MSTVVLGGSRVRKTIASATSSFIANAHIEQYAFQTEKATYWKNAEANTGATAGTETIELYPSIRCSRVFSTEPAKGHGERKKLSSAHEKPSRAHEIASSAREMVPRAH